MKDRTKAIIQLIIASILWSTGGLLIKLVDWNPIAIAGSRSFIAGLVIFAYLKKPKITMSKPQVVGAIAYATTVILFVMANKMTTSANAIMLQYTSPAFVALLGVWLLREKIHWFDLISIVFVVGGMVLFFNDASGAGNMLGNLIAVISGFFLAVVTVALRFQKDGSPVETMLLGNFLTFIVAIPFILGGLPSLKSILAIIVLGIVQLGISYILYGLAIKHLGALEAVLITVIEPLLNPFWVFVVVGEKPTVLSLLGGLVVLLGVIGRNIAFVRYSAKPKRESTLEVE
ncbi:MAG: DMT family transporter [Clostridiaceae bacterium]